MIKDSHDSAARRETDRPTTGRRSASVARFTQRLGLATISLAMLAGGPASAQLVAADRSWIPGWGEQSRHGEALCVGDFNGDGFEDLAVGTPLLDWSTFDDSGFVRIHLGGPEGIDSDGAADLSFRESNLIGGSSGQGDRFGAALASADFDLDGFDDLAIGIPGKAIDGNVNAGQVVVVYGQAGVGLDFTRVIFFDQDVLNGGFAAAELFGSALAAGPLGEDGFPDLAIGSPGEVVGGFLNAGAVHVVLSGDATGLQVAGHTYLTQNTLNVFGIASPGDRFGTALAIGDVTGDGWGDLLIGSPGDLVGTELGSGAVQMLPGGMNGIVITPEQELWNQDVDGMLGASASGDEFGNSIVLANFDGDGDLDLAIGIPGESQFGPDSSGAVQVLYGTSTGLSTDGDQIFFESLISPEIAIFDGFGETLAAADFNADGRDDLAIGFPLDNVFGLMNAGNVAVLYGTSGGLQTAGVQLWNGFFLLTVEAGDYLGYALAAGDFAGRGGAGLAIGVPRREDEFGFVAAGGTLVLRSQSLFSDDFESGTLTRWSDQAP